MSACKLWKCLQFEKKSENANGESFSKILMALYCIENAWLSIRILLATQISVYLYICTTLILSHTKQSIWILRLFKLVRFFGHSPWFSFTANSAKELMLDLPIGRFQWYILPMHIQKLLPVVICGVQQPINIQGYGNFPCNRRAFKNVGLLWLKCVWFIRIFYLNSNAILF